MIEWKISDALVPYPDAVAFMENRVAEIRAGAAPECIWLLEHPPLYTAGTSAHTADLLPNAPFPVYAAGRGGQYTYHGPGQLVAYVMLDLKARYAPDAPDVRDFVWRLEEWIIQTLTEFGVRGERRIGRIGIWVTEPGGAENKIAALGIRIRRGVSFHGISINVSPDLSHFAGIVPCGIREHGVTSLKRLGILETLPTIQEVLRKHINVLPHSNSTNS